MTREEAIKELRDMLKRDIAEYGSEGSEYICEAVARAIAALDAAEKQEKNDEALMRIAETFENVNAAITDIADHFGSQMAMIIDTLEPIAKVFRDDDEAAADADETCDNDCEHCDWATCPKEDDDL